jgi:predicted nucleic acid-binding protein
MSVFVVDASVAVKLGERMVTADERLVNGLANGPWADYVVRLQDLQKELNRG